jgi:hypothetical protein
MINYAVIRIEKRVIHFSFKYNKHLKTNSKKNIFAKM